MENDSDKLCPMCRRPLLKPGQKRGRGFLVGKPKSFLICRDCWKGWVLRNTVYPSRVLVGTINLFERSSSKG